MQAGLEIEKSSLSKVPRGSPLGAPGKSCGGGAGEVGAYVNGNPAPTWAWDYWKERCRGFPTLGRSQRLLPHTMPIIKARAEEGHEAGSELGRSEQKLQGGISERLAPSSMGRWRVFIRGCRW